MSLRSTLASVTIRRLVLPPGTGEPNLGDDIRDAIVRQLAGTEAAAASQNVAHSIGRSIVRHPSVGEAGIMCPAGRRGQ